MKKEDFYSILKNTCPDDSEVERTKQIFNLFDFKTGEELTRLYLKTDNILPVDAFGKIIKVSTKE